MDDRDHDGAGQEDRGCGATDRWSPHLAKAVLKENRDPKLEMPHNQARAVAVEEKNLDGGIEEESNAGQRQREEEQSVLDEQAAGRGLRRKAQEEPQIKERADPQPGEEGEQQRQRRRSAATTSRMGTAATVTS